MDKVNCCHLVFFVFLYYMGAEQSLIGGDGETKRNNYETYKAVKSIIEEQGKDFHKQVFLDLPDIRVLKRLGIFKNDKKRIKNIVIHGHGSLVTEEEATKATTLRVPDNIVVLFMGELGYITWSLRHTNIPKEVCHKEIVPNQIALPGSTIPNVSLSTDNNENKPYSTGIFDCELEENNNVNLLEDFEHYLIPTEENITKSMEKDVQEMLKKATEKATEKGKDIINSITLSEILEEISKKIPKDKYGFVYVFSCLGVCRHHKKDQIELYTKPEGFSPLRGYTIKKIPARVYVSRFGIGTGNEWNPVLTNDKAIIESRNWFVEIYNNKDITDRRFIDDFDRIFAFAFGEKWRDHLPDLDSDFIQSNDSMLRRDAFVNHFKFIDLLYNGTTKEIKNAWNMQFEDKTKFLMKRISYINYIKEEKNLIREEVKDLFYKNSFYKNLFYKDKLQENKEIFEKIEKHYKQFENYSAKETIRNFIKTRDLEGLKEFIFSYMKQGVNGNRYAMNFDYEILYNEDDKDNETVKKALKILEAHYIYNYTVLFELLKHPVDYYIENKDELKNTLDIMPYIDYVNSDEYIHPRKENIINKMDKIKELLDLLNEKEEEIFKLFKEKHIETIKDIILGYTKNKVKDVNYSYMTYKLLDEGYNKNLQNIMFMHWKYDDLIQNGKKSPNVEFFIRDLEPPHGTEEEKVSYRNALDITPYIDYVNSDEYVHPEKVYVIEKMNEIRKLLGFTDVQQSNDVWFTPHNSSQLPQQSDDEWFSSRQQQGGQGRAQQYGGMWQRGGFFMTCS